jgi:hypothetical protein
MTLIDQGDQLFNWAYTHSDGTYIGTTTFLAGHAAGWSEPNLKIKLGRIQRAKAAQMAAARNLRSTSDNANVMAKGAEWGSEIGSVIPVIGTAIGAVVGVIVGAIDDIFDDIFTSRPPQKPEGEFRSSSEQAVFPMRTDKQNAGQSAVNPVTYPNIRKNSSVYQVWSGLGDVDPISGQDCPVPVGWAAGWVSPPHGTAQSAHAGRLLADLWASQSFRSIFPNAPNMPQRMAKEAQIRSFLVSAVGEQVATQALAILASWLGVPGQENAYGISKTIDFSFVNFPPFGHMSPAGQYSGFPTGSFEAFVTWFLQQTSWANRGGCALDFLYYVSPASYLREDKGEWYAHSLEPKSFSADQGTSTDATSAFALAGMPDTSACGLGELAILIAQGVYPFAARDIFALHWVTGQAWTWRAIAQQDALNGALEGQLATRNHENFSRLIAILHQRVAASVAQARKGGSAAAQRTQTAQGGRRSASFPGSQATATRGGAGGMQGGGSGIPWGKVALAVGIGFVGYQLFKKDDEREGAKTLPPGEEPDTQKTITPETLKSPI